MSAGAHPPRRPSPAARHLVALAALAALAALSAGCGSPLTPEELLDPAVCGDCHAEHYRQWSGSMHAYAARDPVFQAMNVRGQRETDGELGDFCISCHAPMAVRLGETTDGLDMDELPDHLGGVTCAFCHQVEEVVDDHNAGVRLAPEGGPLRGPIEDPDRTSAHAAVYSPLHDRDRPESASLCGSCHDIVTPAGVHLERTFAEWQGSVFAQEGVSQLTCGNCHMRGRDGTAVAFEGATPRRVHDHTMVGVDVAITDFPERDEQAARVQEALDDSLIAKLCVVPAAGIFNVEVTLENVGAGHFFPSGASLDRRVWVELRAWVDDDLVLSSGVVEPDQPVAELADPYLWLMRDVGTDEQGEEVHMFWDVAEVDGNALIAPVTFDPTDPDFVHSVLRTWPIVALPPTRVEMVVRVRPIGLEVLGSLVASGDLDESLVAEMPTWDLRSTRLVWEGPLGTCVQ